MKLTRELKIKIGKQLISHGCKPAKEITGAMKEVPGVRDPSGKPLFITAQQYNKILETASRRTKK